MMYQIWRWCGTRQKYMRRVDDGGLMWRWMVGGRNGVGFGGRGWKENKTSVVAFRHCLTKEFRLWKQGYDSLRHQSPIIPHLKHFFQTLESLSCTQYQTLSSRRFNICICICICIWHNQTFHNMYVHSGVSNARSSPHPSEAGLTVISHISQLALESERSLRHSLFASDDLWPVAAIALNIRWRRQWT